MKLTYYMGAFSGINDMNTDSQLVTCSCQVMSKSIRQLYSGSVKNKLAVLRPLCQIVAGLGGVCQPTFIFMTRVKNLLAQRHDTSYIVKPVGTDHIYCNLARRDYYMICDHISDRHL